MTRPLLDSPAALPHQHIGPDLDAHLIKRNHNVYRGHLILLSILLFEMNRVGFLVSYWSILMAIAVLVSCTASVMAKRRYNQFLVYRHWRYTMLAATILNGSAWSFLCISLCQTWGLSNSASMLSLFIVAGCASSATTSLASHPRLMASFIVSILLPIASYILILKNSESLSLGLVILTYLGFLMIYVRTLHQRLHDQILYQALIKDQFQALRGIFDTVPGLVSCIDEQMTYRLVNKNVEEALNCPAIELLGQKFGFAGSNSKLTSLVKAFMESNQQSQSVEHEWSLGGENRWYLFCIGRITSPIQGAVIVGIDISEIKNTKDELEVQKLRAIHSSKLSALGEMAAGIAHEINNPLTIICGRVQELNLRAMEGDLSNSEVALETEKINATALKIAKIIKSLKALSRSDEQDPSIVTSVDEILSQVLEISTNSCKAKGIKLTWDNVSGDLKVACHPVQISQVLINLLRNSCDAIETLADKWIHIGVTVTAAENLQIRVTDSGLGIPPAIAEKIMTPFFTTKEPNRGTGLGLSVSQNLMVLQGGQLYLDKDSKNTCFVIQMPLQAALVKMQKAVA